MRFVVFPTAESNTCGNSGRLPKKPFRFYRIARNNLSTLAAYRCNFENANQFTIRENSASISCAD
jgi:hypothetical protein